jgi:glycosyltransferase involved in cell wall biosynthesis
MPAMRVQIVDPPAYTPPYDFSLAAALARGGADVELSTSRATYAAPTADGFTVHEDFYRRAMARDRSTNMRRAARLAEHVPDMLRHRRRAAGRADVIHYQWLTLEPLDARLLANGVARVFTAHNVIRRGGGRLRERTLHTLVDAVDATVVHTHGSKRELVERFGAQEERVRVIPHGAFDYLTRLPDEQPLPDELAAVDGPVILSFGILRPYKGVDVLVDAFRELPGAELWIVGRPWMDAGPLRAAAAEAGGTVRFVDRFVAESELPAYFRRADVVALPYRSIDQSGVLYTALAFGKAIVASAIGGFREIGEEHGAVRLVPAGDAVALRDALASLLADPAALDAQAQRAAAAAAGPYSWDEAARLTLALYEELLR